MLGLLLLGTAVAGEPPCAEITSEHFLEGDHFWVQWDAAISDEPYAVDTLAWAEEARRVYMDELGYAFTDRTILIRLTDSDSSAGLATTSNCPDGTPVPVITLFSTGQGQPGLNTTMHEVVHAVQYAYMETYTKGITSWPWWMEGNATWLTTYADGNTGVWARRARAYLEAPWTGLHQDQTAYLWPELSSFLYGTGILVRHLDATHGPDAVKATWEYGALHTGQPIFFPDAIEHAGIDFEAFWHDWMARAPVLDIDGADELDTKMAIEERVGGLPAEGAPKTKRQPQGLGLSIVHFKGGAGKAAHDLEVSFTGDPNVPWMGVLVRTKGKSIGGKVVDVVPLTMAEDGTGTARLPEFDGSRDAYLVVSPITLDRDPHDYAWSASLVGAANLEEPESKGCGCSQSAGTGGLIALLLVLLPWVRRRR